MNLILNKQMNEEGIVGLNLHPRILMQTSKKMGMFGCIFGHSKSFLYLSYIIIMFEK